MLSSQELCALKICWLLPGQICPESRLGLNEYAPPNVVARFQKDAASCCRKLSHDKAVEAMLCSRRYFFPACPVNDPLVEIITPVTIFEFEPTDIPGSLLANGIEEHGAAALFSEHLDELEQTGAEIARRGMVVDRGRWGMFVHFHILWVYPARLAEGGLPASLKLAGHVDLYRFPLAMFAQRVDAPGDATLTRGQRPYARL
jgi:hypothetical protein